MVAVESRTEANLPESDVAVRRDGGGSPPARPTRDHRAGFQGLVALVSVIALVAGFYALGRGLKGDTPSRVSVGSANASTQQGHAQVVDDRGFSQLENGHQHAAQFEQPTDPATRRLLAHQLTIAREVALQYPTIKDAAAAGYRRAGPFVPGLGTHYINFSSVGGSLASGSGGFSDDQLRHPLALIYDGTQPGSPIAGLMYYSLAQNPPEGFAGPNDVWHYHTNICVVYGKEGIDTPLGADNDATKAQCDAVHGQLLKQTNWMLHVWVVPGYESSVGVFSHTSPAIMCNDGTYRSIGLDNQNIGTRTSLCLDNSE